MYLLLLALVAVGNGMVERRDNRLDYRLCFLKKGRPIQEVNTCTCPPGEETVLDLGPDYYPRYLASFQCEAAPCFTSPYYCSGMPYKVQVLKLRETGDALDQAVPESLKATWKFVHIPINVGCMCSS